MQEYGVIKLESFLLHRPHIYAEKLALKYYCLLAGIENGENGENS